MPTCKKTPRGGRSIATIIRSRSISTLLHCSISLRDTLPDHGGCKHEGTGNSPWAAFKRARRHILLIRFMIQDKTESEDEPDGETDRPLLLANTERMEDHDLPRRGGPSIRPRTRRHNVG